MALTGIIFDFDGTLIDSNALHVEAWQKAFARFGYSIGLDRIAIEVGKGGDTLVPSILGPELNKKDGEKLRKAQPEEFQKLAEERGIRVFPGARELLEALHQRGLKTVLATSSGKKQLNVSEKASGFKVSELVDTIVNSDDIETSKPAPDLVAAAVKKLKMSPAECAMIGDTPYDAESSKHAGVVCIGVTCGGRSAGDLLRAGARATWRDPADILAHLDEFLRIASPAPVPLTEAMMERLMKEALAAAREAMNRDEVPIGAVLARGNGDLLSTGWNSLLQTNDKTAHAEMMAFANARGQHLPDIPDLILVSTLEPCVMCLGAAMEARVDTVLFGLSAPADGGTSRVIPPQTPGTGMPRIIGGILADETRDLFRDWLKRPDRNPEQMRFVRQLLEEVGSRR